MSLLIQLIFWALVIFFIGFHFSSWYRCPVCKKWFWLGADAILRDYKDGTLYLFHDEVCHRHTPGYHGLGGKPLE